MKSTDGCDMQPHMLCALSSIGRKTETRVESNQYSRQQVHGVSFKKRAPRAIKEIRAFAENAMVSEKKNPRCILTRCSGCNNTVARSS